MTTIQSPASPPADENRFVYQADPGQPPSEAVITAIGMHSDADDMMAVADDLEPLYNAIDPTALDTLFESTGTHERANGSVTFNYAGHCVTVDTTGRVELAPVE